MQQVERAARAHYDAPVAFPIAPVENQLSLRNDLSQTCFRQPIPTGMAENFILARALTAPRRTP
jgi:hypothetical protein